MAGFIKIPPGVPPVEDDSVSLETPYTERCYRCRRIRLTANQAKSGRLVCDDCRDAKANRRAR